MVAVGDILLSQPPVNVAYDRSMGLLAGDVTEIFEAADIVVGNLECTLPGEDHVPTEPRVFTRPSSIRAVKEAGFELVTLANNHMFDGLDLGFRNLRNLLSELSLPSFGAGENLDESFVPVIVESGGISIAFIGAADKRTGLNQVASKNKCGVAPLDANRLAKEIAKLRSEADHVVVSLHWGDERFAVPSPDQMMQARMLAEAGASLILGHHPHVIQGTEVYRDVPIVYSLGNFIADDVYYENGDAIRWNRLERTGCMLVAEFSRNRVSIVEQVPTFDDGRIVAIDKSGVGKERIKKTSRLVTNGVSNVRYRKEYFWIKTLKPTLAHLRPSQWKNLRPRHIVGALRTLRRH